MEREITKQNWGYYFPFSVSFEILLHWKMEYHDCITRYHNN